MRTNLSRYGRDGLIARLHHNQEQCDDCNRKLEAGGLDLSTIPPLREEASPKLKGKAIDRLAAVGITPIFHKEADILDRRARSIERVFGANMMLARNVLHADTPILRPVQDDCDDMMISMFDPPVRPFLRLADDCDDDGGGGSGPDCRSWSFLIIEKDTATAAICLDPLTVETCPSRSRISRR